jgi:DNA repair protein RadC
MKITLVNRIREMGLSCNDYHLRSDRVWKIEVTGDRIRENKVRGRFMDEKADYLGHRKRLREKFLRSGLAGFNDYEIVELLLSLGKPRTDLKPQAKEALRRFKNLRGVLDATPEQLQEIKGIGPHTIFGLKFMQAVAEEYLKAKSQEMPLTNSSEAIYNYFYASMRGLKKEILKAVYLNNQNQILSYQDISEGTVDSNVVYPREIIEGAIKNHAAALVIVHNHPSGNPQPSESDKALTRNMVIAADVTQIRLLDHIIIGDNRFYSFAGSGLIQTYKEEASRLKESW